MTMPNERTRALIAAYELVREVLSDPAASPALKQSARWVARHYPAPHEIQFEALRQTHPEPTLTMSGPWLAPDEGAS